MPHDRFFLPPRSCCSRPPCSILGGILSLFVALAFSAEVHADERAVPRGLIPSEVSVTAGALFPSFLIYENPVPFVGAEVGWRMGPHTVIVANAGMSVIWVDGSQRFLHPISVGLRVLPWEKVGPWIQFGVGSIPWIERISLALPQRLVTTTDTGAPLTAKVQAGIRVWRFDVGVGVDFHLLPSPFYQNYQGVETLPWDNTFMAWIGWRAWTKDQMKNRRKP